MSVFLIILGFMLLFAGLAGCIIPGIPGPPLSYVGLLLVHFSGMVFFSSTFLIVWAVVALVITLADLYLPPWMTRRLGGSRGAVIGTTLGLIAGIFIFPPWGIILGPFFGALAGELINDRKSGAHALRVAMGSFLSFLLGTGIKIIACVLMLFYAIRGLIVG